MKIVNQSAEFIDAIDGEAILKKIELCGRTAYKSEDKITEDSAREFVRKIIKRGHESVLEHVSISVKVITDRAISHQVIRHRIASYTQESQRFCQYNDEITVIDPGFPKNSINWEFWYQSCKKAEITYIALLGRGVSPQKARKVLPNSTKTEIVITQNLRQWRHFFSVRCAKDADPDMQALANMILKLFKDNVPVVFDDLKGEN